MPIVRLNRWILLSGVVAGLALQQPLFTTALVLLLAPAVFLGARWSPVFRVGSVLLRRWNEGAEREDRSLMRFNNAIALGLLGASQLAFLAGAPVVGWSLAAVVAIAASVALAGFCVGCFVYFQARTRLAALRA